MSNSSIPVTRFGSILSIEEDASSCVTLGSKRLPGLNSIGDMKKNRKSNSSIPATSIECIERKRVLKPSITANEIGGGTTLSEDSDSSFVMIGSKKIPRLNWTRINYDEENHDNRRLVEHRKRNCQCEVCFRELNKLPPNDPIIQTMAKRKQKLEEREIKRAKKKAKLDVKEGKQACIRNFFRY